MGQNIPELPEAWLQALKVENKTKGKTKARITDDTAWVECPYIIEQCLTEGEMSQKVTGASAMPSPTATAVRATITS